MTNWKIAAAGVGALLIVGGIWWFLGGSSEPAAADQRRGETVTRQCSSCGHADQWSMKELIDKGWMAVELSEGPVGEGRKCPRCGKSTMTFRRDPGTPGRP